MVNSIKVYNPLVRNIHNGYGGRAQAIYDECCKVFGWDSSKRYLFGLQQILYAEKVTPEGYSPWFLPHNNWTETKEGIGLIKSMAMLLKKCGLNKNMDYITMKQRVSLL